jgi:uncharacterized integral membrane protein
MVGLMLFILIALVIVIFAVQNALAVPVQFLFWSAKLPLALVIFCSVFAGALLMFCLALWRDLKSQMRKRPQKELKTGKTEKAQQAHSGEAQPADCRQESALKDNTENASANGQ